MKNRLFLLQSLSSSVLLFALSEHNKTVHAIMHMRNQSLRLLLISSTAVAASSL